jgi:hypothetical protein
MGKPEAGMEAQKAKWRACPIEKPKALSLKKTDSCLDGLFKGFRLECAEG